MSDTSNVALSSIATTTLADIALVANEVVSVDLADFGVPRRATVLDVLVHPVSVAPRGLVDPMEWLGRPAIRLSLGHRFEFYAFGWEGVVVGSSHVTRIVATWTDALVPRQELEMLNQAVAAYGVREYARMIIPANTALELATEQSLHRLGVSNSQMKKYGTLNDRLNVLVPRYANANGHPPIPRAMKKELDALRERRNQIAHTGRARRRPTRGQAARYLAAVIFGLEYLDMISR
jgi:hypothetical protein